MAFVTLVRMKWYIMVLPCIILKAEYLSHAYWTFLCLLWRNAFLDHLPFFSETRLVCAPRLGCLLGGPHWPQTGNCLSFLSVVITGTRLYVWLFTHFVLPFPISLCPLLKKKKVSPITNVCWNVSWSCSLQLVQASYRLPVATVSPCNQSHVYNKV